MQCNALLNAKSKTHYYRQRSSQKMIAERSPGLSILAWLYTSSLGRFLLLPITRLRFISKLFGWWQKKRFTKQHIPKFIEQYQVNVNEIELPLNHYNNFNAFFTRKLRPEARTFTRDTTLLPSPSDGKVLVYPFLNPKTSIPVKSALTTPEKILGNSLDSSHYIGGSAAVIRLAPYDYHRFHFIDNGSAGVTHEIDGNYHSVNPIAISQIPDLFSINKRSITEINTVSFGRVACIEVGALNVGSIIQTYVPGTVIRGHEKGYFQFGGSTIVLLFSPNCILFDDDLLTDSSNGIEVHVSAGESIGRKY